MTFPRVVLNRCIEINEYFGVATKSYNGHGIHVDLLYISDPERCFSLILVATVILSATVNFDHQL